MFDLRKELVRNSYQKVTPFTKKFLCVIPKMQPALFLIFFIILGCYDNTNDLKNTQFPVGFFNYIDTGVQHRQGNTPSIMIFGDSRMYGGGTWDGLDNTVFNCAYPGTTTSGVIYRLHYFDEYRPDIVIIGVGINNTFINTAPEEYIRDIRKIIDHCKGARVIVLSIPQTIIPQELADEYNVLLSELPEYLKLDFTSDMMEADGTHFNSKGYEYLTKKISETIPPKGE